MTAATPGLEAGSPGFARTASLLLRQGKTQEAMELCIAGTHLFPGYPTGSLVLGRCYEALGRDVEALAEYRKVLSILPDSKAVGDLAAKAEQREASAFEKFAELESRSMKLPKGSWTVEEYLSGASPAKETNVDFLLKQLQNASKIVPAAPSRTTKDRALPGTGGAAQIVTVTLAEIYAEQGQYGEAVTAYRKLIEQRPADADRYAKRVTQLEELAKSQGSEGPQPSEPDDE